MSPAPGSCVALWEHSQPRAGQGEGALHVTIIPKAFR